MGNSRLKIVITVGGVRHGRGGRLDRDDGASIQLY